MRASDLYEMAVESERIEAELYWTRNNALLVVNGVFVSFVASQIGQSQVLPLIAAPFGIFLTIVWFAILRAGKHYVASWDHTVRTLEKQISSEAGVEGWKGLRGLYDEGDEGHTQIGCEPLRRSSTTLMGWVIYAMGVLWLAIGVVGLLTSPAETPPLVVELILPSD